MSLMYLPHFDVFCDLLLNRVHIEWFSIEYHKTKTKVITLANHKEHRQYSGPIKTRNISTIADAKRGKTSVNEHRLVVVLLLIG